MALLAAAAATPARADFYFHHWENHHGDERRAMVRGSLSTYSSDTNLDADGNAATPAGLQSYGRFGGDAELTYGVTRAFTLFGRLAWARVSVESVPVTGSTFGFTDQTLGANFRVFERRGSPSTGMIVDLQFQLDLPVYDNSKARTEGTPFMGDGSVDITGGGFITLPLWGDRDHSFQLAGGLGYTYRNDGFSTAFPYSAVVEYAPRVEGWLTSLGILGAYSLKSDEDSATTDFISKSSGTGGSFASNAVNPSLANLRARIGYRSSPELAFDLSFTRPVWGQSVPVGMTLAFGVEARLGPDDPGRPRKDPAQQTSREYGKGNQGFVNYNLEARVLKASDRLNLVKISKGTQDGVAPGQLFDIFELNASGQPGAAVARGKVTSVRVEEAALTVTEYFKEVWIDEGFVARRVVP
jgi:hypothetical protein